MDGGVKYENISNSGKSQKKGNTNRVLDEMIEPLRLVEAGDS